MKTGRLKAAPTKRRPRRLRELFQDVGDALEACLFFLRVVQAVEELLLAPRRERLELRGGARRLRDRSLQVRRHHHRVYVVEVSPRAGLLGQLDGGVARRHHQAGLDERDHALLVQARPAALRLARREDLQEERVVEPPALAVDPAEAQRFFDGFVPVERGKAGVLLGVDQDDAR